MTHKDENELIRTVVEAIRRRDAANTASDRAREEASNARTAEQAAWSALRDYQDERVRAALND